MCTTASVRDQAGSWDGLAITFLGISSRDLISDLRMKQTRRPEDEAYHHVRPSFQRDDNMDAPFWRWLQLSLLFRLLANLHDVPPTSFSLVIGWTRPSRKILVQEFCLRA